MKTRHELTSWSSARVSSAGPAGTPRASAGTPLGHRGTTEDVFLNFPLRMSRVDEWRRFSRVGFQPDGPRNSAFNYCRCRWRLVRDKDIEKLGKLGDREKRELEDRVKREKQRPSQCRSKSRITNYDDEIFFHSISSVRQTVGVSAVQILIVYYCYKKLDRGQ